MATFPRKPRYPYLHQWRNETQQGWQLAPLSWCPAPNSSGTLELSTHATPAQGQSWWLREEVSL